MKLRIKRISPSSLALTLAAIYFAIGCVTTVLGMVALGTGMTFTYTGGINISGAGGFSFFMLLLNPFLSALVGFISGFLIALVYNFVSPYTMGVIIEADETHYWS